jgi:(1->4)-alpha-D-glucan 1-alpha-D-glucosylmutase
LRESDGQRAIVVVARLASHLLGNATLPLIPAQNWEDTRLILPSTDSLHSWKGLFGQTIVTAKRALWLNAALEDSPVNLLLQNEL